MSTPEERRQAERQRKEREAAEVKALFPERVKQVARELGLSCVIKDYGLNATLGARVNNTGRVIDLQTADYSPDFRLIISGDYYMGPTNHTIGWPHGLTRPSITVNLRRDAVQIAKEIKQRFLPEYDVACTKIAEIVKASTDYRDNLRSTTDRLAAVAGVEVRRVQHYDPDSELQTEFFKYYGAKPYTGPKLEVKASSDGATLEIDCGVELAAKLIEAMNKFAGPDGDKFGIVQTKWEGPLSTKANDAVEDNPNQTSYLTPR